MKKHTHLPSRIQITATTFICLVLLLSTTRATTASVQTGSAITPSAATQAELTANDGIANDYFGTASALSSDGNTAIDGQGAELLAQTRFKGLLTSMYEAVVCGLNKFGWLLTTGRQMIGLVRPCRCLPMATRRSSVLLVGQITREVLTFSCAPVLVGLSKNNSSPVTVHKMIILV